MFDPIEGEMRDDIYVGILRARLLHVVHSAQRQVASGQRSGDFVVIKPRSFQGDRAARAEFHGELPQVVACLRGKDRARRVSARVELGDLDGATDDEGAFLHGALEVDRVCGRRPRIFNRVVVDAGDCQERSREKWEV